MAGFAINLSFYVSWPAQPVLLVVTLVAAVVLFSLWELFRNNGSPLLNLSATFLGLLYVSLLFGTLIGLRELFDPGVDSAGAYPHVGRHAARVHRRRDGHRRTDPPVGRISRDLRPGHDLDLRLRGVSRGGAAGTNTNCFRG